MVRPRISSLGDLDLFNRGRVVIVTGPMGSGMTNFALYLAETRGDNLSTNVWLLPPRPRFFYKNRTRLSEYVADFAAGTGTVAIIDSSYSRICRQDEAARGPYAEALRFLARLVFNTRGTLILTGSGFHYARDLEELVGCRPVVIVKESKTRATVSDPKATVEDIPPTAIGYDTRGTPSFHMDIDPVAFSKRIAGALEPKR